MTATRARRGKGCDVEGATGAEKGKRATRAEGVVAAPTTPGDAPTPAPTPENDACDFEPFQTHPPSVAVDEEAIQSAVDAVIPSKRRKTIGASEEAAVENEDAGLDVADEEVSSPDDGEIEDSEKQPEWMPSGNDSDS